MIWLIGNRGMLGSDVEKLLERRSLPFMTSDIDVDITDPAALRAFAGQQDIEWIINCSAYTAVDAAEDERSRVRVAPNAASSERCGDPRQQRRVDRLGQRQQQRRPQGWEQALAGRLEQQRPGIELDGDPATQGQDEGGAPQPRQISDRKPGVE